MRLLLFADLHLDAPFAWAPPEVARRRRLRLCEALHRICALAEELDVDALCSAGDLYEQERFTPDTAAFLRDAFARLHPRPVFLAPGNHDWLGPASVYRQGSNDGARRSGFTDNVHLFSTNRLAPVTLAEGLTLWGAAHLAPAGTAGLLDGFRVDRGGVHLALFHGSEQGGLAFQEVGKAEHAPFTDAQVPAAGLHHALVGHFHTPRDAPHHTYPGNPEPLTFGEQGERGAVLVTVAPDGSVTRQRHVVASGRLGDLEVDLTGVAHGHEVRERVVAAVRGMAAEDVRVTLSGDVAPEVDVRLDDVRDLAAVVRLGRITVDYDLDVLAEENTVRGQFVRDVRSADLTDDVRRRVLVTGLRALDGRRQELEVR